MIISGIRGTVLVGILFFVFNFTTGDASHVRKDDPDIDGDLGINRVMLAGKPSLSSDSKSFLT